MSLPFFNCIIVYALQDLRRTDYTQTVLRTCDQLMDNVIQNSASDVKFENVSLPCFIFDVGWDFCTMQNQSNFGTSMSRMLLLPLNSSK